MFRLKPGQLPHHSWPEGVAEAPAAGKLQGEDRQSLGSLGEDLAADSLPQSHGHISNHLVHMGWVELEGRICKRFRMYVWLPTSE